MSERLLTRAEMIKSSGMAEATFDRLAVEPAKRQGRHVYYRVRDVVHAVLSKDALRSDLLGPLLNTCPPAAGAAARQIADETLR